MLLMLSMSSKVSLFGLFSSIDLSSGLANVLLNLLLLLCLSLCHHQMWVSLFASSPTKDISPLLNSWNSFGTLIAFLHISVKCNVNLVLAVINVWWAVLLARHAVVFPGTAVLILQFKCTKVLQCLWTCYSDGYQY